MESFLVFLLLSFSIGFMHKTRYVWRFLLIVILAFILAFVYIFFRKI